MKWSSRCLRVLLLAALAMLIEEAREWEEENAGM